MNLMKALEKELRREARVAQRMQRAKAYEALKFSQGYIAAIQEAIRLVEKHIMGGR